MEKFKSEFKEQVFDKIAKEYFEHNFGSMSKADFETLLFSEYIEYRIFNEMDFDDYTLSKNLGITQSRVRSLKERKELKYPMGGDYWESSFAKAIEKAKYDEERKRIIIPIQDVNVMIEVRHYIEELGWYDERQRNQKLLTISVACFADLCNELSIKTGEGEIFTKNAQQKIKSLIKEEGKCKAIEDFLKDFTRNGLKDFLGEASPDIICEVLKLLPFGGIAGTIIKSAVKIMEKY